VTDELRQLEYSQRLVLKARNVISSRETTSTGRALFDGALRGGSQALGIAAVGLTEGAFADIVSLDADSVALVGRSGDTILDSWIFGAARPMVDCVWARGHKVVKDGRHIGREQIAQRFRRTIEGLLSV
jgi:cytosine/adenosine deaminase-related metal-dependent hydrolase